MFRLIDKHRSDELTNWYKYGITTATYGITTASLLFANFLKRNSDEMTYRYVHTTVLYLS